MNKNEHDHLAELTNQVAELVRTQQSMSVQLNQNTRDTASIKLTLASWTGGKKTLVWFLGFLLSLGIIISSVYAALRSGK